MGEDNYFIEDLLLNTETLLNEIGGVKNFDLCDDSLEEQISEIEHDNFKKEDFEGQNYKVNGDIDIRISSDNMNVSATFYPPSEGMKPLSFNDVIVKLSYMSVEFGIMEDVIKDSIFECNTEYKTVQNVLIAQGEPAVKYIPKHYIIESSLLAAGHVDDEKKDRIDYKAISAFKLVKEGQTLAKIVPEQPGIYGKTVKGFEIQYNTQSVTIYKPGKNTVSYEDRVVASCDGTFELRDQSFSVNEVLQIQSDIGYSTGNIDFPGDIILKGLVKDGFSIKSGGSIYSAVTLDATEVECKGDLYVASGVVGRKQGKLVVGGRIKAKFIENCYVECKDFIMLESGVMNSKVYTKDKLSLGRKGVIVGGCIYAQNGLVATQLGTSMGPRTEIYCGVDFSVENKLKWLRDNAIKVATRLNQVRATIEKEKNPDLKLIELRDKLQITLRQLNESSANLVYKLDKNENADILVRGKIFPGVYLEICHVSYVVNRQMSAVRFRLNKKEGTLKVEFL